MYTIAGARVVDAIIHNPLFLPGSKTVFKPVVFAAGQQLLLGAVVGQVTATGKLVLSVKTAVDGSQVPYGIVPETIDTTAAGPNGVAGDTNADVVVQAYVNASAVYADVSWGATPDLAWAALEPLFRPLSIFGRFPGYSG